MPLLAVDGLVKHFPLGGPGEWFDRVRGAPEFTAFMKRSRGERERGMAHLTAR